MTRRPTLTQARAPLLRQVQALDAQGRLRDLAIPVERALTLYLDRQELVTLMTLGAEPEWLTLGWLRTQRVVGSVEAVESVTVDWEVGAAAVRLRPGAEPVARQGAGPDTRGGRRIVTTGCGQGSLYADLMDEVGRITLPATGITRAALTSIVQAMRTRDSLYKVAGSVHGCALFALHGDEARLLHGVEDVGRHNAMDTLAGWLWMQPAPPAALACYTTGRLTSEMILKAAQLGIPVVVSRSGITGAALDLAQRLGLCAIGRALGRQFLCYSAPQRIGPAGTADARVPEAATADAVRGEPREEPGDGPTGDT